ncbi:reverse transcriptase [Penicillium cf. griseofulvum]|uniref:Reverse transcriptase n=1 Tax=Penicillium cf. griseofulvum TaxID=2972120 RepID=A0A9W9M4C7_9EURO|nr:reverse transcriptase [Penicillium cf. griseofulvum]
MSLEEYTRYQETFSDSLADVYQKLTMVPSETSMEPTWGFEREQRFLGQTSFKCSINDSWFTMTPYWRWVAESYREEMARTYGSLAAANREFMPLGVVKTLREDNAFTQVCFNLQIKQGLSVYDDDDLINPM